MSPSECAICVAAYPATSFGWHGAQGYSHRAVVAVTASVKPAKTPASLKLNLPYIKARPLLILIYLNSLRVGPNGGGILFI